MKKGGYLYIMGNDRPTLYIGVATNLVKRTYQHWTDLVKGFTQKYKLHKLLYFEEFSKITEAIARENQIKNWRRQWKLNMIKSKNPKLRDLYPKLI